MRAQQRHQQELVDLVNDLLCHSSSFVSTTPEQDPPLRRRRQRLAHLASPARAASCIPLDSPLVRGPSGPPAVATMDISPQHGGASKALIGRRTSSGASAQSTKAGSVTSTTSHDSLSHSREASAGPSPTTTPKHDLLRSHSRRQLVRGSSHKWGQDSPLAHDSPPALHSPHPRHACGHVCAECAARAHSGGKVPHAKGTAASTLRRSQTAGSLSQPAHTPPEPLRRAPSLRKIPAVVRREGARRSSSTGELTRAPSLRKIPVELTRTSVSLPVHSHQSRSHPPATRAPSLRHLPVELTRAPSASGLRETLIGPKEVAQGQAETGPRRTLRSGGSLKAVAHALIASFPTRTRSASSLLPSSSAHLRQDLPVRQDQAVAEAQSTEAHRGTQRQDLAVIARSAEASSASAHIAMIQWEHEQRLALAERRRQARASGEERERREDERAGEHAAHGTDKSPLARQGASKLLVDRS